VEGATVLVPHEGWWDRPQHNLTQVTFQPIRNAATRTAALLGGQIDALVELPLQDIPRIEANATLQVVQGPELRTIYLGFDHHREELVYSDVRGRNPLRDIRVRRAIYQAIDVEALRGPSCATTPGSRAPWRAPSCPARRPTSTRAPSPTTRRPRAGCSRKRAIRTASRSASPARTTATCMTSGSASRSRACSSASASASSRRFETLNVWSRRINSLDVSMFMLGHAGLPLADSFSTLSEVLRTRTATTAGLNVGRWSNAEFDALVDRIARKATRRAAAP
jgi:peptide/nickel transport system substrate-binding protein